MQEITESWTDEAQQLTDEVVVEVVRRRPMLNCTVSLPAMTRWLVLGEHFDRLAQQDVQELVVTGAPS